MLYLPNGIGIDGTPFIVSIAPLQLSGNVWFVDSVTGVDAAGDAGKSAQAPLDTLGQAVTNASDNDIIVLSVTHDETLTGALTVSKKLTICGSGITGEVPLSILRLDAASGNLLTVTGTNVELSGIKFPTNTQANADPRIKVSGSSFAMHGCYVECAGNDDDAALELASGANLAYLHSTTFISTATSLATRPHSAILTTAAISDLTIDGVILDAGAYGFTNIWAFDAAGGAITRLRCPPPWGAGLSQLRGADINLASATGRLSASTATGSARVDWS